MYNLNLPPDATIYALPCWYYRDIKVFTVLENYREYLLLYCGYCKTYHGFEDPEVKLYNEVVQEVLNEHKHE